MPETAIRDMIVDDLPRVFRIGAEEFDMTSIYHQYWNMTELVTHFERDKELCVVAEIEGHVIGFALGHKRFSVWDSNLGHLEWLAVSREYQRKGIGTALCREMIARLEKMGVKRILADTRSRNVSQELLEKLSFKKIFSVDWFIKEN